MMNVEKLKEKIRRAKHQSKPEAENATVVRDSKGNWLFEVYSPPGGPIRVD